MGGSAATCAQRTAFKRCSVLLIASTTQSPRKLSMTVTRKEQALIQNLDDIKYACRPELHDHTAMEED